MDTVRCFFVSFFSAKICCENQGTDTGTDVYYISTCKVNGADCCKESALSPDHMSHRIVNKKRLQCNKCKQCLKSHPSDHSTGDQCRSNHGKHHLECSKYKMRNGIRIRTGFPANIIKKAQRKSPIIPA